MGVSAADHRQFVGRQHRSRHGQISKHRFDLFLFCILRFQIISIPMFVQRRMGSRDGRYAANSFRYGKIRCFLIRLICNGLPKFDVAPVSPRIKKVFAAFSFRFQSNR